MAPESIKNFLPYRSIRYVTMGMAPREVIPKEPIIKPILASVPPSCFMYNGKRKKDEKLLKKKKLAAVIKIKFLNPLLSKPSGILFVLYRDKKG